MDHLVRRGALLAGHGAILLKIADWSVASNLGHADGHYSQGMLALCAVCSAAGAMFVLLTLSTPKRMDWAEGLSVVALSMVMTIWLGNMILMAAGVPPSAQ
jgi:hypothetical protein